MSHDLKGQILNLLKRAREEQCDDALVDECEECIGKLKKQKLENDEFATMASDVLASRVEFQLKLKNIEHARTREAKQQAKQLLDLHVQQYDALMTRLFNRFNIMHIDPRPTMIVARLDSSLTSEEHNNELRRFGLKINN